MSKFRVSTRLFNLRLTAVLAFLIAAGSATAQTQVPGQLQGPGAPPAADLAGFVGVWLDDTGQGAVEIAPCGDRLCGRVVWLRAPNDKSGQALTDGYNPEVAKRKRPICGLPVIGDLKRMASGSWDNGWIYDPKEGRAYDVELKVAGPDRLRVTGYLGTKFFGEAFIWTRAPASLQRCAATSATNTL